MHRLIMGAIFVLTATSGFAANNPSTDPVKFSGDVRFGYFSNDRKDRNRSQNTTDEFRLRVRAGVGMKFTDTLSGKVRFAGRYSTEESNHPHFELFKAIPAGDGLRRGDSTLDELFLAYKPNASWKIRAGRFQTKFELDGVAKKSLDRANSGNTDITWVDGVHAEYKFNNGWKAHGILQYNSDEGSTEVRRGPLNFSDDGSRASGFFALESKKKWGPIVQRAIDLTYLPDALQVDGNAAGRIDDYWAIVGRTSARWPLGTSGMKFQLSGELGYAGNRQTKVAAKTGTSGEAGGTAAQVTFNFVDIIPHHSAALVLGRVEAGWLLSPDFRNNNTLIETRYVWKMDKKSKLAIRLRQREDLDDINGALRDRVDTDFYVRYTHKF